MNSTDLDQTLTRIAQDMHDELKRAASQSVHLDYQLVYDTGTVYGKRYYTVGPVWEPDRNGFHNQTWADMMQWCVETFGKSETSIWAEAKIPEPMERWYANNSKFWFRDQRDRDWFTLRWAS